MKSRTYLAIIVVALACLTGLAQAHGLLSPEMVGGLSLLPFCVGEITLEEIKKTLDEQGNTWKAAMTKNEERIAGLEATSTAIQIKLGRPGATGLAVSGGKDHDALERAFKSLIAGDQAAYEREVKAMSTDSDPNGGYITATHFSDEMTRIMMETAPFIGLARTVEIIGTAFEEPVDRDDAGAGWVGERETRPDTDSPELGMVRIELHELEAMPKVTQKLIDTCKIDIVAWLSAKVAEKFANVETDAYFNGNGMSKPRGFLTYTTAATADATRTWGELEHVKSGANGAFAASNPADVLFDLEASLKAQYRKGAVWMMNRTTQASIRKLKEATSGAYLWQPGLIPGTPGNLLGYPIVLAEEMPTMATNSLSIAFGNLNKGYTIVRRLGVRMLVDPFTDKPNVRLYTYARVGGAVNNFEAIKFIKFAA